ncbi:hypothetical protein AVEN_28372-1 [Araneus ventricosus]|uniref:Uncharacterized protein n=1 Tax=Araneus ventricosus TaxID=182803 RepID=A0A4Y2P139_ARAVE|nr:hypothetical protein AVEN_28372-1 [Araneus ventricosus]
MFISGDLGDQWKCLKSEEYSWSYLVATLDVWGVSLSCWNCPNPSECPMDMNEYLQAQHKETTTKSSVAVKTADDLKMKKGQNS